MNVREYWTVLREDKWLVGSVLVVCVAIAAAVALLLPRAYTSTAIFYVASPQTTTSSSDSYQGAQLSTERVKSYSELLTGPRVAADASALLGGQPSAEDIQKAVSADSVAETVVLNLGVTESTPEDAQLVGTAVATSFTRLVNSIESTGQPVNRPIVSTELIYPPTLPTYPSGPGTTMLLAAGVLAGLVLGVGAALGRRAMRRAVDTSETLEAALGAPVLAAVPGLPRRPDRPALLAEPAPGRRGRGAARARDRAAAVRRLRTAVLAGSDGRRCLVVAGVRAEQGTTTVALDLAVALAVAGESVLLVDADLRRPALARRLELHGRRGLASVLDGGPVDDAVQRWAPGGLDVLPAGPGVERPGETWGTTQAAAALRALRDAYSWVLLDASPVATSPESVDLARLADGVVLVARRGSARPEDLDAAASGLRTVGTPLIGSVFTFAVDVPAAPAEARRALPPGRSAETPPETPVAEPDAATADSVVTAPAPTEPATTTEPDDGAVSESTAPESTAPVAAAASATALASAARARRSRTVRRSAPDLTPSATQERISGAEPAPVTEAEENATTPTVEAAAATPTATEPKRRTSTRKRTSTTATTEPSTEPAAEPSPPGSDTAPGADKPATRNRKARTTAAASETAPASTPYSATPDTATADTATADTATPDAAAAATPAPVEKPARKSRTARRTAVTPPTEPAPADAAPSTADLSSSAPTDGSPVDTATTAHGTRPHVDGVTTHGTTTNGAAPTATTSNGSTPTDPSVIGSPATRSTGNGSTGNGSGSNGAAAGRSAPAVNTATAAPTPTAPAEPAAASQEPTATPEPAATSEPAANAAADEPAAAPEPATATKAPRARRPTRATSQASSPTDATTTVEPEQAADPEKPTRGRTSRARTPRVGTTGRGPDATDTATRPARTRATRTNPTSTPTSGS